jgi:hypothetical protein
MRPSGPVAAAKAWRPLGKLAIVDQLFVLGLYASTVLRVLLLDPPMA